jgi:K+-sensing histidine kinase KdpD
MELQAAYEKAQEANQLKTDFLHNMTNQMIAPAEDIVQNVTMLCNNWSSMSHDEAAKAVDDIQGKSKTITELLNSLLKVKTETIG